MIREITNECFYQHIAMIQKVVNSWPAWKLETRASQFPIEGES